MSVRAPQREAADGAALAPPRPSGGREGRRRRRMGWWGRPLFAPQRLPAILRGGKPRGSAPARAAARPRRGLVALVLAPSQVLPSAEGLSSPDMVLLLPDPLICASQGRRTWPLFRALRVLLVVCPWFMPRSPAKRKRASGADLPPGPAALLSSWLSCLTTNARC